MTQSTVHFLLPADLKRVMPGATTSSNLHWHEWGKHGVCYGSRDKSVLNTNPDTYFEDAISLLDQINASPLQKLISANIGETVTNQEILDAFERISAGASKKVQKISCQGDFVTEIQIGVKCPLGKKMTLQQALGGADTPSRGTQTCRSKNIKVDDTGN